MCLPYMKSLSPIIARSRDTAMDDHSSFPCSHLLAVRDGVPSLKAKISTEH